MILVLTTAGTTWCSAKGASGAIGRHCGVTEVDDPSLRRIPKSPFE
jgi:hypothetical protein